MFAAVPITAVSEFLADAIVIRLLPEIGDDAKAGVMSGPFATLVVDEVPERLALSAVLDRRADGAMRFGEVGDDETTATANLGGRQAGQRFPRHEQLVDDGGETRESTGSAIVGICNLVPAAAPMSMRPGCRRVFGLTSTSEHAEGTEAKHRDFSR
jgi:hypothetical protein